MSRVVDLGFELTEQTSWSKGPCNVNISYVYPLQCYAIDHLINGLFSYPNRGSSRGIDALRRQESLEVFLCPSTWLDQPGRGAQPSRMIRAFVVGLTLE